MHVVFGAGPAGLTVAQELLARGERVRIANRGPVTGPPEGAEVVQADVTDHERVREVSRDAEVLYNCTHAPYHLWDDLLPRMQAGVLAGARASGAKLVVIDTLYPYGPTGGVPMTERTPNAATSRKGRIRIALTQEYFRAHEAGEVRVTIGRSADFFGPRVINSTLGGALFPAALTGQTGMALGDIDLPHSYTYMPDIGRGLATLGTDDRALGRLWHLPTAPARTTREIHQFVERYTGRPLTLDVLDGSKAWGPFDETFMREYEELFYQYTEPQIVDSGAIEHTFGLTPTPIEDALRATVDWYRAAF